MLKKIFSGKPENIVIQFFRNMIAGITGTIVDFVILIICEEFFSLGEFYSTIFGFVAGLIVNYIICRYWVFPEAAEKNALLDFGFFITIGFFGLLLTQIIIAPFSEHGLFGVGYFVSHISFGTRFLSTDQYYIIGKAFSVVLVYFWNFFTRKKFLYKQFDK